MDRRQFIKSVCAGALVCTSGFKITESVIKQFGVDPWKSPIGGRHFFVKSDSAFFSDLEFSINSIPCEFVSRITEDPNCLEVILLAEPVTKKVVEESFPRYDETVTVSFDGGIGDSVDLIQATPINHFRAGDYNE